MKRILLLLGLILGYIGTFAQSVDKAKPLQGRLESENSDKIFQNDKKKLQLSKPPNSKSSGGFSKVLKKDSVYLFLGDSLAIRRSVTDVPHMLEDQVPLQGYLNPDNAPPVNPSGKNSPKIQRRKKRSTPLNL